MKLLFMLTLFWSFHAAADLCQKSLSELNKKPVDSIQLDPHVTYQVTAAANRIAKTSLWTEKPEVLKIQDNVLKSIFSHRKTDLVVFYNNQAEIFGYIQTKKKEKSFWCMKEK